MIIFVAIHSQDNATNSCDLSVLHSYIEHKLQTREGINLQNIQKSLKAIPLIWLIYKPIIYK